MKLALITVLWLTADLVRLESGGTLRGEVVSEGPRTVVLRMPSGEITLPRGQIAAIERDGAPVAAVERRLRRNEWYFLLKEGVIVGWARVLHGEEQERIQVEERLVLFDGPRDRRRVEIAGRDGAPHEYLWIESTPGVMEVWSGQVLEGRHVRQHRKGGKVESATVAWPEGARLPLVERSRARLGGEAATRLFHPRTGGTTPLARRRAPVSDWNGTVMPTTEARVALARRRHAPADARDVAKEAMLHPLTPRPLDRTLYHLPGGVVFTAPNQHWVEQLEMRTLDRLFTLENRVTFARVECHAAQAARADEPLEDYVMQFRGGLADQFHLVRPRGSARIADGKLVQTFELRQGDERWQAILHVHAVGRRRVALLALAPVRRWAHERENLRRILASVKVVD
ncbi:MAG: hypothetical protein AAGD14_07775 [Planctomycetota bacterium]